MATINNTTPLWMLWFDHTTSGYVYIAPGETATIWDSYEFLGYYPRKDMLQYRTEVDIFQRMIASNPNTSAQLL